MARYTDSVCRLCRREGQKLFLKGTRCYTEKCAVVRRSYAPGQHGNGRNRKGSEYSLQLRAKQKARRFYGVLESQFSKYFDMAVRKPGITGENLLIILESRMDNVIYRLGLANSRKEARQLVNHGHFQLNGHNADIPSILLREGDVITVKDHLKKSDKLAAITDANGARPIPAWLDLNAEQMEAKVVAMPKRDEIDLDVEEHLIVEFYSK